ncbi:ABC transporter ATP-binding protein [Ideonella sp. YS5]|uniref:ABC transporter ATP-binding protein n=1 Tax=Ideonella sp. YS5 TaxID=3453714 RepID=UPI003EE8D8B9
MASIELAGVGKRFGHVHAVDGLSLQVADGEFLVLLGPSGAGKTTTLRLIAGLEKPDSGRLRMNGEDVTDLLPAGRDCAFVFQQYSLYPHLTVFDNLAFPLRSPLRRMPEAEIRLRVGEVAELLHIESKLARKATALSGGEMQRVAIGRALVRRPQVFLMDEPLSSLDAKLREELRVELRRLQQRLGATVVYVTHDHVEATTMADRIGILDGGRLQQIGTPAEVYTDPRSLPVAQRLGSPAINLLPAQWFAGHAPAGTATVAIRPEDVALGPDGAGFEVIECSLVKHQLVAERDGIEVQARLLLDDPLSPGSLAHFHFPPERCLYFDATGQRL